MLGHCKSSHHRFKPHRFILRGVFVCLFVLFCFVVAVVLGRRRWDKEEDMEEEEKIEEEETGRRGVGRGVGRRVEEEEENEEAGRRRRIGKGWGEGG